MESQIIQGLMKKVKDMERRVEILETRRITQEMVTPQVIKNRAMGEPNSYVYSGLAADRPTTGVQLASTGKGCSIFWATDTGVLSIWNGTAWLSETFT
jgi:hypothetical protein